MYLIRAGQKSFTCATSWDFKKTFCLIVRLARALELVLWIRTRWHQDSFIPLSGRWQTRQCYCSYYENVDALFKDFTLKNTIIDLAQRINPGKQRNVY
jgi:hypothetical protein